MGIIHFEKCHVFAHCVRNVLILTEKFKSILVIHLKVFDNVKRQMDAKYIKYRS